VSERLGYSGRILWVDLGSRTSVVEERDELFWRTFVGGGLAGTALLLERTGAGIDPLGPENLLILASGVVAGHRAAGLARFSTVAKSPLTGGIGETRTEGPFGAALKGSGVDIIVFTGRAATPTVAVVDRGRVELLDAREHWGTSVGETTDALEAKLGRDIHVAAIGSAGEKLVRFASIVTDRSFQVSRMGMGAVMGSKLLKAVVIRDATPPPVHDAAAMARITASFAERMRGNDLSRWQLDPPGFSCWIYLHGIDAAVCVNNYRESTFPGIEGFKEERFREREIRDLSCPGCPNACIKAIHPGGAPGLDPRASGIHQEITGTMGPNIGVGDLDVVLRANNLCNQQGMDPTSLGFTISCAMELAERGLLDGVEHGATAPRFGDGEGALALAGRIARRDGLGDLLAEGSLRASRAVGHGAERYAMQVKGLEMVCFEPRSQTNLALGYAVAPIGPRYDICEHDWDFDTSVGWDHTLRLCRTLGILERVPMGYMGPDKVRAFKALHTIWSAADALGQCIFAVAPTRNLSLEDMAGLLRASTGWETSSYELMRIGERRLHLMRAYNLREGLGAADDRLPDRFHEERISSGPRQGDVLDRATFAESIRTFYAMMGWDEQGRPSRAAIYDHRLEGVLGLPVSSTRAGPVRGVDWQTLEPADPAGDAYR
jgi:aldehyde:ferredoxin oxidoreductase